MSISSARLSAHYCCICLLLSITSETAAKTTPSVTANKVPGITHLDSTKAKCQYNLTDSSHLLEAHSPIHPLHSFSQCEYIIQAPSSRFILLNFTENYSQSDMPVQPSVRSQHFQQEATHTTTTTTPPTESILPKAPLRAPKSGEEDSLNTTVQQSQSSSESVPTALDQIGDLDYRPPKKSHNTISISDRYSDKHKTQPGDHKSSLDNSVQEQAISKETLKRTSFSGKDSAILPEVKKGSLLELNSSDTEGGLILPTQNCSLKLIIEEVNDTSGSGPQVICWGRTWQHRIPIVFQYTVPIRITYVWDGHKQNGFFLDFSFLKPEAEVDCLFRCNNHLCLPRKHLCDGNIDCPDHSDELNSACILDNKDNGDPHIVKVIIIIISVIIGIGLTLFLVFMINYIRCHNSARRGGGSLLQPPYSQSSEVCHSTTDSIQESGQCETLLSQHPPRQTVLPALRATSSHFLEHQQLLQHQRYQPEFEQQQQQQCRYHTSRKHCLNQYHQMSQEHQIRSLSSSAAGALPPDSNRRIHKCLQQKHVHHQQKLPDQHVQQLRQHRQANKHANPDELYPPNIPLSADGEEGYAMSQRALHCKQQLERNWQVENEMFRPPPNKTVFDRDSPPPPYSLNLPGAKSLDSLIPPLSVPCVLRPTRSSLMPPSSPPAVPRSQSLSCHH